MDENQQEVPQPQEPQLQEPQPQYIQDPIQVAYQPIVNQKQRRVGTFTLGLTLIMIGVIIPLTMIFKDKALFILQFAPVVLILLGIEVLIYALKYKEGKLKYDGFSIFLVIMITIVSIGAASIVPMVTTYVKNERIVSIGRYEMQDAVNAALKNNDIRGEVYAYPLSRYDSYGNYIWFQEIAEDKIEFGATVNIHWRDTDKIPTEQEVSQKLIPFVKDIDCDLEEMDIEVIFYDHVLAYASLDREEIQEARFEVKYREDNYSEIEELINWEKEEQNAQESVSSSEYIE